MKIDSKKCINIRKIVEYLGKTSQQGSPNPCSYWVWHKVFLHAVGKIKVLKKCLNCKEKLTLLNTTLLHDVEKFTQTVRYSEKEEESLTETRVQLYKQMKTRTSVFTTR